MICSIKLSRDLLIKYLEKDGENNYPEAVYNHHQINIKSVSQPKSMH